MWDLDHDLLPESLSPYFIKRSITHGYRTRHAESGKLSINKTNTKRHGQMSFQVQGSFEQSKRSRIL